MCINACLTLSPSRISCNVIQNVLYVSRCGGRARIRLNIFVSMYKPYLDLLICEDSKGSLCAILGGDEQVKQNRSELSIAKLNTIKTCLFFILSSPSLRQAYRFVFVFGLCRTLPFFSVFSRFLHRMREQSPSFFIQTSMFKARICYLQCSYRIPSCSSIGRVTGDRF